MHFVENICRSCKLHTTNNIRSCIKQAGLHMYITHRDKYTNICLILRTSCLKFKVNLVKLESLSIDHQSLKAVTLTLFWVKNEFALHVIQVRTMFVVLVIWVMRRFVQYVGEHYALYQTLEKQLLKEMLTETRLTN